MLFVDYKNFKCEDCGSDKFTVIDDFSQGHSDFTLNCATKDCEASYTFSPEMKFRSSFSTTKICSCGGGFLSRHDNHCSGCGKKNPHFKLWRKENIDKQAKPKRKKK